MLFIEKPVFFLEGLTALGLNILFYITIHYSNNQLTFLSLEK